MNRQQRRAQERNTRRRITPPGATGSQDDTKSPSTPYETIPVPISTTVYDYKAQGSRFIAMQVVIPNCAVTYSLTPKDAIDWAESVIKIARKEVKGSDGVQRVGSGLVIAKELPNV